MNDNRVDLPAPSPAPAPASGNSSVIAAGTNLAGNLDSDGDMLIEGQVRGSVRALRLTVGVAGAIEGDIAADEVTVRGAVKGPIQARHIHLESGAEVEGDLTTDTIAIDTGARLSGSVWQRQHEQEKAERYTPVAAASWSELAEENSRSLLGSRPRITASTR